MISQGEGYFLTFILIYGLIPKTMQSVLTIKFVESANMITLWECFIYFCDSMQRLMNITDIVNK